MKLYFFALICLFVSGASCSQESQSEEGDSQEVSLGDINKELHSIGARVKKHMEESIGELNDIAENVIGGKLDRIFDLATTVRRNQKFLLLCGRPTGVKRCGEHGICELSADEDTYHCECEEGYAGRNCEITAPCEVELYKAQQLPPMPGRQFPICVDDGSYASVQFVGSQAYCVTSENVEISGYMVNVGDSGDMNCQCARDEITYGRSYNCLPNGNYPRYACDSERCWCQDAQGFAHGESIAIGDLDTLLNC